MAPSQSDWDCVDRWARERSADRGDLYGWSRMSDDATQWALLLVAQSASDDSFPRAISDIPTQLRRVPEPEGQSQCSSS